MQRSQRIGLLVAAGVIAVVAVIVLRGGDDDDSPTPDKPPEPELTAIVIKDGKAVGREQEIEANKGETVQFRVESDADHEIHLHGYDLSKDVAAGGQVAYKFTADIDGLFEIEIEDLKAPIAELRVNP